MWDEVRRAFRMSREAHAEVMSGRTRSHAAWFADPHLRRGYLWSLPIFVLGAVVTFAFLFRPYRKDGHPFLFFFIMLPFAFASNLLWFFLAARFRRKAGESGT